ncbi:hypothetical protein [Saccharopolyspora pogona]
MTTAEQVHAAVEGLTITELLRRNARDHPDRPALTTGIVTRCGNGSRHTASAAATAC